MSHGSWCAEHPGEESNQRLEFLGDAVLGMAVAAHVYRTFPTLSEGPFSKIRAGVVNAETLHTVARRLELGDALRLGRGEEVQGGREKPSILADALEAVIGAVYLDGGWGPAEALVLRLLADHIDAAAADPGQEDFKSQLQEITLSTASEVPGYRVVDDGGPDHAKSYTATVTVAGRQWGEGCGRSKKQAEQAAAQDALTRLADGSFAGEAPSDA